IRQKTADASLPLTDENIGATARRLREELGMDAVAILTAETVRGFSAKTVLIDGIRGDAEVRYFRSVFDSFTLIFIKAAFVIRLQRMQTRGRSDDTTTEPSLRARDEREESFGLAAAAALADITLSNETGREQFEAESLRLIRSLA
ncbi:MAG: dephospho-CoA kinase, partial [Methanocorpusculum sp.]|nr:dephospho-CoA kinase [Methanocorpusculum sp.]